MPEVLECALITGSDADYQLTVMVPDIRITSYNVCYTKLLRIGAGDGGGSTFVPHRQQPDQLPDGLGNLVDILKLIVLNAALGNGHLGTAFEPEFARFACDHNGLNGLAAKIDPDHGHQFALLLYAKHDCIRASALEGRESLVYESYTA